MFNINISYNGQSYTFDSSQTEVQRDDTDEDVKNKISNALMMEGVEEPNLSKLIVERFEDKFDIRPVASFG